MTVPQPSTKALQVLMNQAKQVGSPFYLSPDIHSYGWGDEPMQLGMAGDMQLWNASLALQLSKMWLDTQQKGKIQTLSYSEFNFFLAIFQD